MTDRGVVWSVGAVVLALAFMILVSLEMPAWVLVPVIVSMIACAAISVSCALAHSDRPTLKVADGCRLTNVGQIEDARVIRCRTCGLARLTWPGDSVTCFYRDDIDSRNVKQALDQMPMGERREAPRHGERFYRVPDGHCFECGEPAADCRCDGL